MIKLTQVKFVNAGKLEFRSPVTYHYKTPDAKPSPVRVASKGDVFRVPTKDVDRLVASGYFEVLETKTPKKAEVVVEPSVSKDAPKEVVK
jgi:hypothetical protein